MRRVLVLTWALGTATGVLLGLFGVQLVSSRFATAGVSPLSRPEVQRALLAARSVPGPGAVPSSGEEVAVAPPAPAADPAPEPPRTGADRAGPSPGPAPSPPLTPPASALPRPGATGGTLVEAGVPASSSTTTAPVAPAHQPDSDGSPAHPSGPASKPKSDGNGKNTGTDGSKGKGSKTQGNDGAGDQPPAPPSTTTTTTTTAPRSDAAPSSPSAAGSRTIRSAGGVVSVRYAGGKVELQWARPNAGYQVYVRSSGPDSVVVYFYTRDKVSQVRAFYRGSTPASDVQNYSGSSQQGQPEPD